MAEIIFDGSEILRGVLIGKQLQIFTCTPLGGPSPIPTFSHKRLPTDKFSCAHEWDIIETIDPHPSELKVWMFSFYKQAPLFISEGDYIIIQEA